MHTFYMAKDNYFELKKIRIMQVLTIFIYTQEYPNVNLAVGLGILNLSFFILNTRKKHSFCQIFFNSMFNNKNVNYYVVFREC